jgi:hypothetical protein
MPDDAKNVIHETIHEVCELIIVNPVACPPSPHITLPVPALVENISPTEVLAITPGLWTMSLRTSTALSTLQVSASKEPSSLPHRNHRR